MDAGIIVRIIYTGDPLTERIMARLEALNQEGWELCFAPQAIREAFNALTRLAENGGYGLQSTRVLKAIQEVEASFTLLPDNLDVFRHWQRLVEKYGIVGKSVHDANVVAAALAHGATHLLTLNERDFRRYDEITILGD